jgi:hypothetical protein
MSVCLAGYEVGRKKGAPFLRKQEWGPAPKVTMTGVIFTKNLFTRLESNAIFRMSFV